MTLLNHKIFFFFIFFMSIATVTQANSLDIIPYFDFKNHRKNPNLVTKNQVQNLYKIRQVCMDVCNPPYYQQEYPPSYGNQYDQYNQFLPSLGYGYGGNEGSQNYNPQNQYGQLNQFLPYISSGSGGYEGSQNYNPQNQYGQNNQFLPYISSGYGGYGGSQNYYPQNQYGQYYTWCYRDMFRRKYKVDPGNRQPRVFHYKKSIKEKSSIQRKNRNYNYYQDYINCQRICYPMAVPDMISTLSTSRTKVTWIRTTKMTTTTTESTGSNETSEVTEATVSPPEKPDNNTSTIKPTVSVVTNSTINAFPTNNTNESSLFTTGPPVANFPVTQKPQGKIKRKVCETDNQDRIEEFTDKTYGKHHDYNFNEIVKELVYFNGLAFYTLQMCGPNTTAKHGDCFKKDFVEFPAEVRSSCTGVLKKCVWNNVDFNCCDFFQIMDTEVGMCFGINSIQVRNKRPPRYPMVSNKDTGPGNLYLEIRGIAKVYLLGEQEVPTLTTVTTDVVSISPHIRVHRFISIREMENQREVKDVSVEQRKCKFTSENDFGIYDHYSYSACCVQCRKNAQLNMCGCVHHQVPYAPKELFCDIDGLYCLNEHYNDLIVLKPPWSNRTGLVCDCLPSCTEFEMTVIKDYKSSIPEDFGIVEITLERLPSERYKRKVVHGKLDLVVSTGGITALFLGASILSFVEVVYYFFVRPIGDNFV